MSADVDVSVVLPVYNEKGHLRDEIDRISTAFESSPYSWEIIVVDDGSDDGSAEQIDATCGSSASAPTAAPVRRAGRAPPRPPARSCSGPTST
jgi:hypothetical protein